MTLRELLLPLQTSAVPAADNDAAVGVGAIASVGVSGSHDVLDREISGVVFDSRRLKKDCVFVAVRGGQIDGHDFIKEAVREGALALIVESLDKVPGTYPGIVVQVPSTRRALSLLGARYQGEPSRRLKMVGVTGTNGKTTITHMLESILNHQGWPTGVIGTIDHHLGERVWKSSMTTPDPLTFQSRLRELLEAGAEAVALEVSSHALAQARVDGVDFDVAIFSNLTRDHLDYHQTMEQYFAAKARLFSELLPESRKANRAAVVHRDGAWGEKLVALLGTAPVSVLTFGRRPGARFQYEILQHGFEGARFSILDTAVSVPAETSTVSAAEGAAAVEYSIQMPGLHNVQNAVSAILAARALGVADQVIREALASLKGVAGRLERVPNTRGLHVFVDYAHSDDALRSILRSLEAIRQESAAVTGAARSAVRLFTVFGCGGDRDKGKRPMMCRAALDHSDVVVVTSDNPRSEDPEKIIDDILTGARSDERAKLERCVDRRQAIQLAISLAKPGDVVLIAGKGHERTQTIGDSVFEFSDVSVTEQILRGDT